MPLLAQAQKLVVVLVLIVAVFALVLGVFIGHSLDVVPLDTTTHASTWYGWSGVPTNPGNNFLDATSYVTSWSPQLLSEPIIPKASESFSWPGTACVKEYRTRAYLTTDGIVWNEMQGSPWSYPGIGATGPGPFPLTTPTIYVSGQFVGGIKVEEELHIADGFCLLDKGWLVALTDQAYLVSGIGKISADAHGQVGQTISATTIVGYVNSLKSPYPGWALWAFSTAQNKVVGTWTITALQQTFQYTLTSADFATTANCGNGNRIEWHLKNQLWQKDFTFTTVVDIGSLSPAFSFDGYMGQPVANGSITLAFHGTPNPVTNFPLKQVVIAYGFGGISNILNLTGNASSQAIPLGSNGNLHIEGYSIDTACRPSPSQRLDIFVSKQGGGGGTAKPNWLAFWLILIGMASLGGIVAYVAKGPIWARVLLFLVIFLFGLVVAFVVVPNVLNPATYFIPFLKGGT